MRLTPILALMLCGSAYANPEITVDLPGGATMEFVWIEPGTFVMGSPEARITKEREWPQHKVTITQGYYLAKYELTQGQWQAVMGTTPWSGQDDVQENPDHPAVYLAEALSEGGAFFERLNEAADLYRLPTEAEWEYACRAGTTTKWSFGDDESQLDDYAWHSGNTTNVGEGYAHAVGTKLPNAWGLHDMHANVWEPVLDWWSLYESEGQIDPLVLTSTRIVPLRVVRSGSYNTNTGTHSARRENYDPARAQPSANAGLRLLRQGSRPTAVTSKGWGEVKTTTQP